MSAISTLIGILKEEWGVPREAIHRGKKCPFLLACSFRGGPASTLYQLNLKIPNDIHEFWQATENATLFEDQQYGQWGIEVLSPEQALHETSQQRAVRPKDFVSSDLVFARFFGDSDLVVIRCDPAQSNFGSVIIALPIDRRKDWPAVANSLEDFLKRLMQAEGDKYWEIRG